MRGNAKRRDIMWRHGGSGRGGGHRLRLNADPLGSADDFSSRGRTLPICRVVPTFLAMFIASVAGWLVQSPVSAILGPIPSAVVSLLVAAVAFFFAKRFLSDLRGGS